MEDKTLSGYEKLDGLECETTGNSRQHFNSTSSPSCPEELASDDIFFEDFPDQEIFILSEEYVMMEEEYVMWEGTHPGKTKSQGKGLRDDFDGPVMLPSDESLQHLGEYFTLKARNRRITHN